MIGVTLNAKDLFSKITNRFFITELQTMTPRSELTVFLEWQKKSVKESIFDQNIMQ